MRVATEVGFKCFRRMCMNAAGFQPRTCCCNRAQREFLSSKLENVEGKLKEAKADRRENERERKMRDAVIKMKELFPGACIRTSAASPTCCLFQHFGML